MSLLLVHKYKRELSLHIHPMCLLLLCSAMTNAAAILEEQAFAIFRSRQKLLHVPCLASEHTRKRQQAARQFNPGFPSRTPCFTASLPDSSIPQSLQT